MLLSSRFFRRSALCLLGILSSAALAQTGQFLNVPVVRSTGGRVTSLLTGNFQSPSFGPDIFYINAPVVSGTSSTIAAGLLLYTNGQGFQGPTQDQITFSKVSSVVSALGDFNHDGIIDFAFALTPSGSVTTNLCVYYGTGVTFASNQSSFNGANSPNAYPPTSGENGCTTFTTQGAAAPKFTYMAALPLQTTAGSLLQLLIEDSANNRLYVLANNGQPGTSGALTGFTVKEVYPIPALDGAGPIYIGDFNHDGNTDFIVNGQTGFAASIYFGNGDGTFQVPAVRYPGVHSMLLYDMDNDSIPDLVAEDANGAIEIFKGSYSSTAPFATVREGGTPVNGNALAGVGGHLAAIDPNSLDILTTTPIGLSVLQPQSSGSLNYTMNLPIYNIGPGRESFALASFFVGNALDLVVDQPQGVLFLIADANGDGGFQSNYAYPALAPALGSTVGRFRNAANNPKGNLDVVVNTGPLQGQLLEGNGDGTFTTFSGVTNTTGGQNIATNLWSNILTGDFNEDGIADIAFSLTGLPLPPGNSGGPAIYYQLGDGDGTFQRWTGIGVSNNTLYGETAVGDLDGNGVSDFANISATYDSTLLNPQLGGPAIGLDVPASNTAFSQVAVGFFKENRAIQQDLIFQQGSNLIPYKNAQDNTGKNFTPMTPLTGPGPPLYPGTVLLTDIDGDGNGDLVVVYYDTALSSSAGPQMDIWYGNGDGTFQSPQVWTLPHNDYLAAAHDMNGDGLPDIVLSDGSVLGIVYNHGSRSFGVINSAGNETQEVDYLAGQGINSITIADVNGDGAPDIVVANGGLAISNPLALGGATATSLTLPANPADIDTGGITVLLNSTTTQPVTPALTASPEPSTFGAAFTITATLTPTLGVAVPTGTVQFYIDGQPVGTPVNLAPTPGSTTTSTATYTVLAGNTLSGGLHPLTAFYSGDTFNTQLTFSDVVPNTHLITGGATTTNIFMCVGPIPVTCPAPPAAPSPTPVYSQALTMYYGQIWNGILTTTANDNSVLSGFVDLDDTYTGPAVPPANPLCVLPVLGGSCSNTVGTSVGTSVGVNVLTGVYLGDASHTASTSLPVAITVLPDLTGNPMLTGAPNPSPQGQPVTLTATLTGNFAAPTGPGHFRRTLPAVHHRNRARHRTTRPRPRPHQHRHLHHHHAAGRRRLHLRHLRRHAELRRANYALPHHHREHHPAHRRQLHPQRHARLHQHRRRQLHAAHRHRHAQRWLRSGRKPHLQQSPHGDRLHLRHSIHRSRRRHFHALRPDHRAPHLRHDDALLHRQQPCSAPHPTCPARTRRPVRDRPSRQAPLAPRTPRAGRRRLHRPDHRLHHLHRPRHPPRHVHHPGYRHLHRHLRGPVPTCHHHRHNLVASC
jgi:hypothetical protein